MDEDTPETPSIDAEEVAADESEPATVICPYCYEENDALKLVSSQVNRCWKCGHIVGANDFVPPYDIKVGGPSYQPTGARLVFMWMARLIILSNIIGSIYRLFWMIRVGVK